MRTLTTEERKKLLRLAQSASPEPAPPVLSPIERVERGGRLRLSFAQQRLWFLERMGGLGSAYHIPGRLHLRGELDREALVRALDRLVERHEALRTTFGVQGDEPEQRIGPATSRFALVEHDLAGHPDAPGELARVTAEEAAAPFDLERGPLIRGRLVRLAEDDHLLLLTMHHIVADGWSMGVLTRELSGLYGAFRAGEPDPLPELPIQYADYAAWQRRWVEDEVLERQAGYWTKTLAGAPALLELPTDHPRPPQQDHAGARLPIELDEAVTAGLKALGRRHGTTLFMTLLAGWAVVLGRLSGQEAVVVGTPTANRGRREIEGLIGFFANTLALRVDLSARPTVAELLAQVKRRTLEAQQNQDIPFEQVVERVDPARTLAYTPLFQVMLDWQNAPRGGMELPGIEPGGVRGVERTTAKFDLSLTLAEADGRIVGGLTYATSLFARETVERWAGYLRRALEEMAADESRPVERLALLPADERARVLEAWNRTDAPYPAGSCIHALFEQQVERAPGAVAVEFAGEQLTYAELNRRANRLAHHLVGLGVGPEARVAIALERGAELITAMLGVLKAGGAYVPLDPAYPAERLRFMLEDSAAAVLLARRGAGPGLEEALSAGGTRAVWLDEAAEAISREPDANPGAAAVPGQLCYVLYTSGSTGRPKGVAAEHHEVVHLVRDTDYAALGPGDRVAQASSPSFDAVTFEIWGALLSGATLVGIPREVLLAPAAFRRVLREARITTLYQTTALLNLLSREEPDIFSTLRELFFGGQAVEVESVRRVLRGGRPRRLVHVYGPTEIMAWSCTEEVREVPEGARTVPIGRPIARMRMYLLDQALEPVPVGAAGEICVGGAGVARGYLDRPELTAERFVADPFGGEPGARLYRTGDLGRWTADGRIEFVGRTDEQVKIRGFRIELGEIEARLAEHPGVNEAVVLAREDVPGDQRLVAYWTPAESGAAAESEALRSALSVALPEHMVPAAYVRLDALPLTPTGKLDRRALPAPEGDAYVSRGYEAPVGEVERAVAEIWAEVLEVERVGRHDHFFELGGHSLLAVKLIERMRRRGLHVEVRALFTTPTLWEFALAVSDVSAEVRVPPNAIPPGCEAITPEMLPLVELGQAEIDRIVAGVPGGAANVQDIYPLAPLQEGIFFHHLMAEGHDPYLNAQLVAFDTRARLDAFLGALQRVVDRHDIMRTAVAWEGLREPAQVVWRRAVLPVEEVALDAAGGDVAAQLWARFDPRESRLDIRRAPMMRLFVAADPAQDRWVLLWWFSHLVQDHQAFEALVSEVEAHLRGRAHELPPAVPYRNYVAQARLGVSPEEHERFFRELLGDVTEPTVPFGVLETRGDGTGITDARLRVDAELSRRVRERVQALGVSAASVFHLAWAQVLARVSGRDDVVFGTVLFGRMAGGAGADRVMGMLINTLPVRLRVGDEGAAAAVRSTHAQLAALLRHEHASLALAQRCSGVAAPAPLFTSLLNYRHSKQGGETRAQPAEAPRATGGIRGIFGQERTNYPVGLWVDDLGDGFLLSAQAVAAIDPQRVCAFMHRALERLADALEAAPATALRELDVLPEAERRRVVEEWNRTEAEVPRNACIHALFEAQVGRTPGAEAVVFAGESLTYAALNARANRLAHHLVARGVGPDQPVAICVERGMEMVVGLLAVLKAGGGYVPLDPAYPEDRLRYTLADSRPALLLTQATLRERFADLDVPVLALDADAAQWADLPETNPDRADVAPEHLAYVIYTSGSTGQPKGVMVEHRNVARLFSATDVWFGFGPDDVWTLFHSFAFDFSVWEIWGALLYGGRLVVVPRETARSPEDFYALLCSEGVTVLNQTPSAFRQLITAQAASGAEHRLRYVIFGGEALELATLRPWFERNDDRRTRLVNMYGITETTVHVTYRPIVAADAERPGPSPIGVRIPDLTTYILDARGLPVPVGVTGELYVGGAGVARGYLNRPELTAERFVRDPFSADPEARLYRTGDLGRWLPDGTIEYLGRNDQQVKIRGFRIELGEIEARLAEHEGVREAVVDARGDAAGDRRLVAYYVGEPVEAEALRAHLGERLPEHMMPAAYVRLDALPLTPSGKLDRGALPAPEGDAYARRGYEAPLGETEQALAEIWSELLGVERIGRHDDFFELGGHSLLATRLAMQIQQSLEVDVTLRDVFENSVLSTLAQHLVQVQLAGFDPEELARLGALLDDDSTPG